MDATQDAKANPNGKRKIRKSTIIRVANKEKTVSSYEFPSANGHVMVPHQDRAVQNRYKELFSKCLEASSRLSINVYRSFW